MSGSSWCTVAMAEARVGACWRRRSSRGWLMLLSVVFIISAVLWWIHIDLAQAWLTTCASRSRQVPRIARCCSAKTSEPRGSAAPQQPSLGSFIGRLLSRNNTEEPSILKHNLPSKKEPTTAREILFEFVKGNRRFLENTPLQSTDSTGLSTSDLQDGGYRRGASQALIIQCASQALQVDAIFDAQPGQLQLVRAMGFAVGARDATMAAVDYALASKDAPPVILVLGDSRSEPLQAAMRVAMAEQGLRLPRAATQSELSMEEEAGLALVQTLLPPCRDALLQTPQSSFAKFVGQAAKLNTWQTIETLLTKSATVAKAVRSGNLEVHGAFFDADTGSVRIMGRHPSEANILNEEMPVDEIVRTASSPSLPAEEALASLVAGNNRFVSNTGSITTSRVDSYLLEKLGTGDERPIASILSCADSRAPVEMMFDVRPGDLFVLRTAGNVIADGKGALLGSAEFGLSALGSKLIVVLGHTKCNAVTEAVKAVRAVKENRKAMGPIQAGKGSIGRLLLDNTEAATDAVEQLPEASIVEQVELATRLNVFVAMRRFIENSDIIREAVESTEVLVVGGIYDIVTGKVEWLGQHPRLEEILGHPIPMLQWMVQRSVSPAFMKDSISSEAAQAAIDRLRIGNRDFAAGLGKRHRHACGTQPLAVAVAATAIPVSLPTLFNVEPGFWLISQRSLAATVGIKSCTSFAEIEYAVKRYQPPVLMFLGHGKDPVIDMSIRHLKGIELPPLALKPVMDQVGVSSHRALEQVQANEDWTKAGVESQLRRLSVRFNLLYSIEQMLQSSAIIRKAAKQGMELHAAVYDPMSGSVEFIGQHPMVKELIERGED